LGAVAPVEHLHAVHRCSPAEKKVSGACRRFWRRVVQWCSSAFLVFSDGKEESCEGRKKTQKTATAIVEKRREKKKKEKGGERK
jgi:hypothetical protein